MRKALSDRISIARPHADLIAMWGIRIVSMLLNLGTVGLLTRHLSLSEFGEYSLLIAIAHMFAPVIGLGSGAVLLRFFPVMKTDVVQKVVTIVALWGGLILGLVSIIVTVFFRNVLEDALLVLFTVIANGMFITFTTIELARRRPIRYSLLRLLSSFSFIILIFIFTRTSLISAHSTLVAFSVGNIVISLPYLWNYFSLTSFWDGRTLRKIYSYGLPLGASAIISFIFLFVDRYIIDLYIGRDQVAIYSFAFFLVNGAFQFLISALNSLGEQNFWSLLEESGEEVAFQFRKNLEITYVIFSIVIILIFEYFGDQVIIILARTGYEGAIEGFVFLGIGFLIFGLFTVARYRVQVSGRTIVVTACYFVALLGKVVFDVVFVKAFGLRAIFVGFIFGYMLMYASLVIWYLSQNEIRWLGNLELIRFLLLGIILVCLPIVLPIAYALLLSLPILWIAFRLNGLEYVRGTISGYSAGIITVRD